MENSRIIKIALSVPEIIFDVRNKTHIAGKSRVVDGDNSYEAAYNMQVSDEDDTTYQIHRSLATVLASLKNRLGEYLIDVPKPVDNMIAGNIDNDGMIILTFRLPNNYNEVSAETLGSGIHSYLVDMVIGDWFTITNKADAKDYIERAGAGLKIVERALYKRNRPRRPNYMPYD